MQFSSCRQLYRQAILPGIALSVNQPRCATGLASHVVGVATTGPSGRLMPPQRYNPGVTSLPIRSCPDRRNRTCIGHIGSTLSVLTILLGSAILPAFRGGAVFGQPLNSSNGDLALVRA